MFGLAPAALDHSPAPAIRAALDFAVEELAAPGPGYIIDGFKAPVI
jgi:hypothetical protein